MSSGVTRVLTSTVIAIVEPRSTAGVTETLSDLSPLGVRPVIISLGGEPGTARREERGATVFEGLPPKYLDNAVASVRLSSLPTLVWWRADDLPLLERVAELVDRLVIDVGDSRRVWPMVPQVAPVSPVSDLRWTRLTRWRELFAQFFEIPDVCRAAASFDRLTVAGGDEHQLRLAAGWLRSRLPSGAGLHVDLRTGGAPPIERLAVSGSQGTLAVQRLAGTACLETTVQIGGVPAARRVVAAGDRSLSALIAEEMGIRSRDVAFEDAVREAERV